MMGGSTDQIPGVSGGQESSVRTAAPASSSGSAGASDTARSFPRGRERVKSVIDDCGVYSSSCGYCKSTSQSSIAQGSWAYRLTVQDYQDLLDLGWRRSGMFLYKPRMKDTCCPPYTIRLRAGNFVASKDQSRVRRKMQRYLDGTVGELQKEKDQTSEVVNRLANDSLLASASDTDVSICDSIPVDLHSVGTKDVSETPATEEKVSGGLKAAIEVGLVNCTKSGLLPLLLDHPTVVVKRVAQKVNSKLKNIGVKVDYTSNIAFAFVALLRRKGEVLGSESVHDKQADISHLNAQEIAEVLAANMSESIGPFTFTVQASNGHLNFLLPGIQPTTKENRALQIDNAIRNGNGCKRQVPSSLRLSLEPFPNERTLEIRMKRSSFDPIEFSLYKKYQVVVHNDPPERVKEGSYKRFLVDTPLVFVPPAKDGSTPGCGFGSFHRQYLIDGKLVAVGVVDILPHCLSSKYLFWDPDLAFLSLGKYSALEEIKWVQEAQKLCSSLKYYYLGFYVHSCPKMRYKAAYHPSELLCPERFSWVPYERTVAMLNRQSYVCLSDIPISSLSVAAGSSVPGIGRRRGLLSSDLHTERDSQSAMEIEAEFSHIEDQEKLDMSSGH